MFRFPLSTISLLPASLLISSTVFAQEPEAPAAEATAEEAPPVEAEAPAEEAEPAEAPVEEAPAEEAAPAPAESEAEMAEEAMDEAESDPIDLEKEKAAEAVEAPAAKEEEASPSLLPLKVGTHTFSRFEVRENYDELGVSRARFQEGDQTVFRARLTLESNPLQLTDSIEGSVYFAPQASGNWGSSGLGGTIGEANLGIYEGYFKLKGKYLTGKVGRFAMNYGDALVIGNLDWHQAGRAFDGAHFSVKPTEKVTIDAFFTQQLEGWNQPQPFLVGDGYFWGLYGQFGAAIAEGLALDAYLLGKSAAANNVEEDDGMGGTTTVHKDGATFMTLGARAKQKIGMFDYRAEAGLQAGKQVAGAGATDTVKKFAYQADIEAGVSPFPGTRIAINGAIASGNNPDEETNGAWDELYPTTHKWFGLMDVMGFRTNIMSANIKFATKFTQSTIFKVDAHVFSRLFQPALGYSGDKNFAGTEIDTQLVQKIGKWAYARGLFGAFIPSEAHYGTGTAAYYGAVQAGLKF